MQTIQQTPLPGADARSLMTERCIKAEALIRGSWKRGEQALEVAALSIGCCLEAFLQSLDEDPFFSRMPPADNAFQHLWMLFLHWGKPEAIFNEEECGLMGLSIEDVCLAFALSQIKTAVFLLSDAAEHPRGWTRPAANELAERHLHAVDSTFAFLERQTARH